MSILCLSRISLIFGQQSRITPGQRCCLSAGSKLMISSQLIPPYFSLISSSNQPREFLEHHVEARMRLLVFLAPAAVEAENAAAARQRTAIEATAHAEREAGHRAHEVGIVAALRFQREFREHMAAVIALQQQFGDAEGSSAMSSSYRRAFAGLDRDQQGSSRAAPCGRPGVEPRGAAPSASSEPKWKMNRAAQLFSTSERSSNRSMWNPAAATRAHSASPRRDPPRRHRRRGDRRRSAPAARRASARGTIRRAPARDRRVSDRLHSDSTPSRLSSANGSRAASATTKRRRFAARAAVAGRRRSTPIAAMPRSKHQPRRRAQSATDVGDRRRRRGSRRDR